METLSKKCFKICVNMKHKIYGLKTRVNNFLLGRSFAAFSDVFVNVISHNL